MQDGSTLRRRFTINGTCELARKFDTLYNSPGFLLSREVIPGELKQSDFAGGAIQGYDKNNEPYYYNLSSKEAYELYTTCILPDLGDSSMGVRHYVNFPTMETAEYSWVDISVELDMSDSWVPSDLRASPYRGNLLAQLLLRSHAGRHALPRLRRGARLPRCPERQRKKIRRLTKRRIGVS